MSTNNPNPLTCPFCGERLSAPGDAGQATPYCPKCHPRPESPQTYRVAGDVLNDVWANLSDLRTWGQVVAWALLLGTTFIPVMALWGADRLKPDEPLLPFCVAISAIGGIVGMPLLYPKKGYWLPGILAGPLFGPGVFLSFWLLAGTVMNKFIFLVLMALGGAPSFALYVFLLHWKARQGAGE